MSVNVAKELAALKRLTVDQLKTKYAETFGEPTNARHKEWLIKRIIWRLQANAEGGLSERAKHRAAELARDADLRLSPPKQDSSAPAAGRPIVASAVRRDGGNRLPAPGTVITRTYKGQTLQVQVLSNGFEYEGELYRSLSAVAKAITGSHCNGYLFFKLTNGGAR